MNTIHYWSGKDKAWVDKITQATKYKAKPTPRAGYHSVKFGNSYVIYFSEKDGFGSSSSKQVSTKLIMNSSKSHTLNLKHNPVPAFDDPEKRRKFYDFARDTLKTAVKEELSDTEIDSLLDDPNTGNIITSMLAGSLDLRRKNRALRTQLEAHETGDTRTLATAAEQRRIKEMQEQEHAMRDLRLQVDIIKTEITSLSDLRSSVRKEVEEAKKNLHGIKTIESVEERLNRLREENVQELAKKGHLASFDRLSDEIARKELAIQELEARNREGLIRKTDLDSFDRLRTEIVQKEARLEELIARVQLETVTHSKFATYEQLQKEVEDLEAMRRYLNTELATRQSRATELLSEIESLTIRRDRAYQEAIASGVMNVPIPSGSTVAPVMPIQQTSTRFRPPVQEAPRPNDPWMPSPISPRNEPRPGTRILPPTPIARPPRTGRPDLEDLEID